jgi:hypothetical protein
MSVESGSNPSESLILLQQKLEQFRSARTGRTRLPEALWQAAVELAKQHGVYPTARRLRLDYSCLKKRLGGRGGKAGRSKPEKAAASFVELFPRPAKPEECIIELEAATGTKMRIQWKASQPPDWSGLLRAWREAER